MTIPYAETKTITLDKDGELEHFEPGGPNKSPSWSVIGVHVSENWVQIGCTRVSRKAWEYIVREVEKGCVENKW